MKGINSLRHHSHGRWVCIGVEIHIRLLNIGFLEVKHANHVIAILYSLCTGAISSRMRKLGAQLLAELLELLVDWVVWACVYHNAQHTTHRMKLVLQVPERTSLSFFVLHPKTMLMIIYAVSNLTNLFCQIFQMTLVHFVPKSLLFLFCLVLILTLDHMFNNNKEIR